MVRGRGVFTQIGGPVVRLCPELWFWKRAQQREDWVKIGGVVFENMITCKKIRRL